MALFHLLIDCYFCRKNTAQDGEGNGYDQYQLPTESNGPGSDSCDADGRETPTEQGDDGGGAEETDNESEQDNADDGKDGAPSYFIFHFINSFLFVTIIYHKKGKKSIEIFRRNTSN